MNMLKKHVVLHECSLPFSPESLVTPSHLPKKNEQIKNKELSCLLFCTDEELRLSRREQNTVGDVWEQATRGEHLVLKRRKQQKEGKIT